MTQVLGYRRFGAFGGDIGGGVTQWLGALYPREVAGVHITSAVVTSDFSNQPPTAAEQAYLDARGAYDVNDQGYSEIMSTRPDTIAAALNDSQPASWPGSSTSTATGAIAGCAGDPLGQGHPADGGDPVLGHRHHRVVVPPVLQLPAERADTADHRARGCHPESRASLCSVPEKPGRTRLRRPPPLEHPRSRRPLHGARGTRAGRQRAAHVLQTAEAAALTHPDSVGRAPKPGFLTRHRAETQLGDVAFGEVGQRPFETRPDELNGIDLVRVGRELVDGQPVPAPRSAPSSRR